MNFRPVLINTRENVGDPITDVRYVPVDAFMTKDVITFSPDMPIDQAMEIMLNNEISGGPVLDNSGRVIGILSEKDCLKVMMDEAYYNRPFNDNTVADYMTEQVNIIRANTDLLSVVRAFVESSYRRFPVLDHQDRLVGQVSRRDILKAAKKIKGSTW
jgi:CBS domain-containing protein